MKSKKKIPLKKKRSNKSAATTTSAVSSPSSTSSSNTSTSSIPSTSLSSSPTKKKSRLKAAQGKTIKEGFIDTPRKKTILEMFMPKQYPKKKKCFMADFHNYLNDLPAANFSWTATEGADFKPSPIEVFEESNSKLLNIVNNYLNKVEILTEKERGVLIKAIDLMSGADLNISVETRAPSLQDIVDKELGEEK